MATIPDVSNLRTVNVDPAAPALGRFLRDIEFSRFYKLSSDVLGSASFAQVSVVTLKSLPYIYYTLNPEEGWISKLDDGLSCRLRFFECAVTSLAAIVYHVVFGAVFTLLSVVTIGKVEWIVDQMRKEWVHAGVSAASVGISSVGTVNPLYGAVALGGGILFSAQLMSMHIIEKISTAYHRNSQDLKAAVEQACQREEVDYNTEFAPFFEYLDHHLNDREGVLELAKTILQAALHLHSIPYISPEEFLEHVQLN